VEIKARYVQIGAFTLAVLVAGFAFVYWLNNAGSQRDLAVYRVRFKGSVSGLLRGSAVLFNGILVGEVTRLDLNPAVPQQVHVTIAVDRNTPIRIDTTVAVDFQGLTGSPVLALVGGQSQQALASSKGEVSPNLMAEVELGCKLLGANGRVIAMRIFRASIAAEAPGAPAAVAALDKTFDQVGAEIVSWTAHAANVPPLPRSVVPKRTSGG
jgi:ABC-type transporter Mla subunit MlaD